jgi:hypothetical protein
MQMSYLHSHRYRQKKAELLSVWEIPDLNQDTGFDLGGDKQKGLV